MLYVGTVVTGSGPHAGDADTERNGLDPLQMSQLHADLVFLLRRAHPRAAASPCCAAGGRPAAPAVVVLLGVELAQGAIGFVQYFTDLPVVLVGFHMLGAAVISACVTWVLLRVRRPIVRDNRSTARCVCGVMNLAEQLDHATSAQPYADRPAAHYVAAGLRARSRRRRTVVAVGVAATAVIGGGAMFTGRSPDPAIHRPPAVATQDPAPSTPALLSPQEQAQRDMAQSGQAATYTTRTGELVLAPGWQVTQPSSRRGPLDSLAATSRRSVRRPGADQGRTGPVGPARLGGQRRGGGHLRRRPGRSRLRSLAAYVDVQIALHLTRSTDELVAFAPPDTLTPRNGVSIVEQAPVALPGGQDAVVARLQVLGNEWWVVARHAAGGATYVPVFYPFDKEPDTLAGFLVRVQDLLAKGDFG